MILYKVQRGKLIYTLSSQNMDYTLGKKNRTEMRRCPEMVSGVLVLSLNLSTNYMGLHFDLLHGAENL